MRQISIFHKSPYIGIKGSLALPLWEKLRRIFNNEYEGVGLYRRDTREEGETVTAYWMCQYIGGQMYRCMQLLRRSSLTVWLIHVLNRCQIQRAFFSTDQEDASFVYAGGLWVEASLISGTFGGSYRRCTNTVGATVTITTVTGMSVVGIHHPATVNGGLIKITLDGSNTRATSLPTAQDAVDSGLYPNTILTANGGSLDPTDRVMEMYDSRAIPDVVTILAEDLGTEAHTIVMTLTGYKQDASEDPRCYVSGVACADAETMMTTPGIQMQNVLDIFSYSSGSAYEYAFAFTPDGVEEGTLAWFGNAHAYDQQASLKFYVDAVEVVPDDEEIFTGDDLSVVRVSDIYSADVDEGATQIGDVTVTYNMLHDKGLEVIMDVDWLVAGRVEQAYVSMFPLDRYFDRGRNIGVGYTAILSTGDGAGKVQGRGNRLYVWCSDNSPYAASLWVPDVGKTLANFRFVPSETLPFIQDRDIAPLNKMYFSRSGHFSPGPEPVSIGDHWTATCYYQIVRKPGVASMLG